VKNSVGRLKFPRYGI